MGVQIGDWANMSSYSELRGLHLGRHQVAVSSQGLPAMLTWPVHPEQRREGRLQCHECQHRYTASRLWRIWSKKVFARRTMKQMSTYSALCQHDVYLCPLVSAPLTCKLDFATLRRPSLHMAAWQDRHFGLHHCDRRADITVASTGGDGCFRV
jgi:hypothetical protein